MKLHPRLTRATLELVTRFESFQPEAAPTVEGGWTVGYGHTRSARQGAQVGRADAEALLFYDLDVAAAEVEAALYAPASQREFEALTAFCFNIGAESFRRSSALARMNAGAPLDAADEIERWRHAELGAGQQVVDALVRRRAAEKAHFLGLPEGFAKSPSALVRPLPGDNGEVSEAVEPPPMEPTATPSATLSAANSVQARLRELIPDVEPVLPLAVAAEAAPAAEPVPEPLPVETAAVPVAHAPPEPAPPESEPLLAPPPFGPPANDAVPLPHEITPPPPPPPPPPLEPDPLLETAAEPDVVPGLEAAPPRPSFRLTPRLVFLALVAVGTCLFVAAVVLILGHPSLVNLGLGVAGALAVIPGVYGLLGPKAPPA